MAILKACNILISRLISWSVLLFSLSNLLIIDNYTILERYARCSSSAGLPVVPNDGDFSLMSSRPFPPTPSDSPVIYSRYIVIAFLIVINEYFLTELYYRKKILLQSFVCLPTLRVTYCCFHRFVDSTLCDNVLDEKNSRDQFSNTRSLRPSDCIIREKIASL